MASKESVIAFIEDDKAILHILNNGTEALFRKEGLPYGIRTFIHLDELRTHLHAQVEEIVCLVTDLADVGWGGFPSMIEFREKEQIDFPVIVTTGMSLEYVTNSEERAELTAQEILIIEKPYRLSQLIIEIKRMLEQASAKPGKKQ